MNSPQPTQLCQCVLLAAPCQNRREIFKTIWLVYCVYTFESQHSSMAKA